MKSLEFGSSDAIYIEDSVFNFNSRSALSAVNDMEYGARMVYRFNTCTACYYQSHSARNRNRGGNVPSEIYRNTFTGQSFYRPTGPIRGGAALLFENPVSGYERNNWDVDGQRTPPFTQSNGEWDFMNYGDGVYVVGALGDLPAKCTPGEWAWVRNAGSWNAAGPNGLGYVCAGS